MTGTNGQDVIYVWKEFIPFAVSKFKEFRYLLFRNKTNLFTKGLKIFVGFFCLWLFCFILFCFVLVVVVFLFWWFLVWWVFFFWGGGCWRPSR